MPNENLNKDIVIKITDDPNEIMKHLQIGISLPLLPELHKFIMHDIVNFKAKSLLIEEKGKVIGHSLIYDDKGDILYFGYFGVLNHDKTIIIILLEEMIKYAEKYNFKIIRGPINIPSFIYGWGFMKEGSKDDLHLGKPVNPSIYQELFLNKGFYVKYEENTWEGSPPLFNPYKLKGYNFSEYEFFTPKNWNELLGYKEDFLSIYSRVMPPSSTLTPNISDLYENIAEYTLKYGDFYMVNLVRYRPTGKIIAVGSWLPSPFTKDKKGNYNSYVAYSVMIDANHQRKGLLMLMVGETCRKAWRNKFRYSSTLTGSDNKAVNMYTERMGVTHTRTHLILELII